MNLRLVTPFAICGLAIAVILQTLGGVVFGLLLLSFFAMALAGDQADDVWMVAVAVPALLGLAWGCGLLSSWIQRHSLRIHWILEFALPVIGFVGIWMPLLVR